MTSDKAIFVLHPEHKNLKRGELPAGFRPMPDNKNHDQRRGCLMVVALCNALVLVAVGIFMLSVFNLSKRFLEDGRDVTVEVINCRMVWVNKKDSPEVVFSYTVDGIPNQQKQYFTKDCSLYAPGQMLSGIYLPDEPMQIRFGEQPETMEEIVEDALSGFLFLACAGMFTVTTLLGMIYVIALEPTPGWQPSNVAREGRITKIYREKEDLFVVEYRFKPSPKKSIKARDEARRPDLIGIPLPEVGTPVTVLYTDRHQHRLM